MAGDRRSVLRYDAEIDLRQESTHTRVLSLVGQRQRVLELGCATGQMTRVLQERGCKVVAIEADVEAAKRAEEFCEHMVVGDLETLDFDVELGDRRFDVMVAADVLEHLKEPEAVLRRLQPFLAPGGYLVASVPNVTHGSIRLALLGGSFPYADTGLLDRTHLRFYNRSSLVEMLSAGGFSPVHIDTVDIEIERSEVPFHLGPEARAFVDALEYQLDALTYQFVVLAFPTTPPLGPIPLLLADVNRRLAQLAQDAAVERAGRIAAVEAAAADLQASQDEAEQRRAAADHVQARVTHLTGAVAERDQLIVALQNQVAELSTALERDEAELDRIRRSPLGIAVRAYRKLAGARRRT